MSYNVIPKATRTGGKFAADGLYYLSYERLRSRGACINAALAVMRVLIGGNPGDAAVMKANVTLTEAAVSRFVRSNERARVWWIASRLFRALNSEQYSVIDDFFSYGSRRGRNPTELIFAMLELVARKDKLLP